MQDGTRLRWSLVNFIIAKYQLTGGAAMAVIFGGVLLCMVTAYLLGSLNFGIMISSKKFNDDVRTHGSGNAGTTNMLRTYGPKAAVLTMAGDMLKAALAVGLGYLIFNFQTDVYLDGTRGVVGEKFGAAISGLFVVLGHMFPCFFKFKGGKGVATAGMVALMFNPIAFVILVAVFVIIVAFTKYVSLGSVIGICLFPLVLSAFEGTNGSYAVTLSAVLIAGLVTYMHRANIKRLYRGEESKLSFKKKDTPPAEDTDAQPLTGKAKKAAQKQAHEAQKQTDAALAEQQAADDKVWTDDKFVTCTGCGKVIPRSRRVCVYCNAQNPDYQPDPAGEIDTDRRQKHGKNGR